MFCSAKYRLGRFVAATAIIALSFFAAASGQAQNRGLMGYDPGSDSGFLRLWGNNGQSASRLWTLLPERDRGILQLYDNGAERVRLFVDDDSTGSLWLYNNVHHVRAAIWVDSFGQGTVLVDGSDNTERGRLAVYDNNDTGFLRLRGPSSNSIALLESRSSGSPNNGRLRLFASGSTRADLMVTASTNAGYLRLYNSNGNATITLDGATGDIAKSGSNGFLIAHPEEPSKEIFYISLEGPERGMYVRGTAQLKGGEAVIELPHHFAILARADSLTVQLTPGNADTRGLAAVRKTPEKIVVRELAGGQSSYGFDYVVFAARKDLPPLEVVRQRTLYDPDGEEPGRDEALQEPVGDDQDKVGEEPVEGQR